MRTRNFFFGLGVTMSLATSCTASEAFSMDEPRPASSPLAGTTRAGNLSPDEQTWLSQALADTLMHRPAEGGSVDLDPALRPQGAQGYCALATLLAGLDLEGATRTADGCVEIPECGSPKSHRIAVVWPVR